MNKTFSYRIYANNATISKMEKWLFLCRSLYNLTLEQRIFAYKRLRKYISPFEQMRQVTQLRHEYPEYREVNASVLHNVIKRLDRAYSAFFRRIKNGEKAGFPRFKSKDRYNSVTFRKAGGGYKIVKKYLHITKIGIFKIKLSRPIEGDIKEITITQKGNKWFASFHCGEVIPKPMPKSKNIIGIDMGCESFLTDSNGCKVANPRFFKHSEELLAKKQRVLSRRKLFSNRRRKAKQEVANLHEKIFNQRKDFHYKVAKELLKNNKTIYIEKMNSWNTHRTLNRSMRDVAWFRFFSILKTKAEEAGREIVEVPAKNTSQLCSACGQIVKKDLSVRVHNCSCGLTLDRDINAARNILRLGKPLGASSLIPKILA